MDDQYTSITTFSEPPHGVMAHAHKVFAEILDPNIHVSKDVSMISPPQMMDTLLFSAADTAEIEDMTFDQGYISPHFVTNQITKVCEMDDPLILIHEKEISSINAIMNILELALTRHRPILIVAEDVTGDALDTLIVNKVYAGMRVCAVKAPGVGENMKSNLKELAILTGGEVMTEELGLMNLVELGSNKLGSCKKVVISKDSIIILRVASENSFIKEESENMTVEVVDQDEVINDEQDGLQQQLKEKISMEASHVNGAAISVEQNVFDEMPKTKVEISTETNVSENEELQQGDKGAYLRVGFYIKGARLGEEQVLDKLTTSKIEFVERKEVVKCAGGEVSNEIYLDHELTESRSRNNVLCLPQPKPPWQLKYWMDHNLLPKPPLKLVLTHQIAKEDREVERGKVKRKWVPITTGINYPSFLSFIPYECDCVIMRLLQTQPIFSPPSPPKTTNYSSRLSHGMFMSLPTCLANGSLQYNMIGFYQMGKSVMYPEFILFKIRIWKLKVLTLVVASVHIVVATIIDLEFKFFGVCEVAWDITSEVDKKLCSKFQQDYSSVLTLVGKTSSITSFFLEVLLSSLDSWLSALVLEATTYIILEQLETNVCLLGGFLPAGSNQGVAATAFMVSLQIFEDANGVASVVGLMFGLSKFFLGVCDWDDYLNEKSASDTWLRVAIRACMTDQSSNLSMASWSMGCIALYYAFLPMHLEFEVPKLSDVIEFGVLVVDRSYNLRKTPRPPPEPPPLQELHLEDKVVFKGDGMIRQEREVQLQLGQHKKGPGPSPQ